jgi:hypothetical protein
MSSSGVIVISLVLLGSAAVPARAQRVRLDRPDAVLAEPFSFVRGVRELSNGRIIISDWIENRVVVADYGAPGVRQVMREGPGPQEVRLPTAIHRLRGDSSLLVDEGNNRLHVLGPDGHSVRSYVTDVPGRGGVRGIDSNGAFLYAIPSWAEGPSALPDDSVRIVRWVPGTDGDRRVLAVVQGTRYRKDRSPSMQPRMPMVGFAAQDAWVVLPSGAIVIVRATPYRVEVHAPGRAPVIGPVNLASTRVVSQEDKKRFMREFAAGSPVSGRGPDGGMGRAPEVAEPEIVRLVGTAEWAERFPPFDASSVLAAADGRIWVGAPVIPGEPVRYDLFDGAGRRALQVELRPGRRVAHVGAQGVHVVAVDEDGIQTLERYRLP